MSPRKARTLLILGFSLPFALALALCLALRPELGSLVAPFCGPWAGVVYGHHDCTMAKVAPVMTVSLALVGVGLLAGAGLLRRRFWRGVVLWMTTLWAVAWEIAALLSVANSTS